MKEDNGEYGVSLQRFHRQPILAPRQAVVDAREPKTDYEKEMAAASPERKKEMRKETEERANKANARETARAFSNPGGTKDSEEDPDLIPTEDAVKFTDKTEYGLKDSDPKKLGAELEEFFEEEAGEREHGEDVSLAELGGVAKKAAAVGAKVASGTTDEEENVVRRPLSLQEKAEKNIAHGKGLDPGRKQQYGSAYEEREKARNTEKK